MKKFGLIGHPIAHSLSPALFEAAFGGKYTYDLIEGEDFEESYEKFIEEYDAINVTAPFKEQAFKKADLKSKECKAIGAANILSRGKPDGKVCADNSDIMGVTGALKPYWHINRSDRKALIVGCGGAAMAAAYAVWEEMGYETVVMNRNVAKARDFVEHMRQVTFTGKLISAAGLEHFSEHFRQADVVIYTLPVAIPALNELSNADIRGGRFWEKMKSKVILQANYRNPAFTPSMIKKIRRINPEITFISGKEWLLHQAIGAYRRFVPDTPDIEAMKAVIQ
jgi:shikimate 5-dehydrogenase